MALFSFGTTPVTWGVTGPVTRAVPWDEKKWPAIVIFALLTGFGLWYGGWWTYENHLFADHARGADAKVLRKYMAVTQGKHGPVYTPHIAYGYQVGNLIVNCDNTVQRNTWDQVEEGGPMPIKYLPEDPANSRISNTAEDAIAERKGNFGLLGGLVGFVLCIVSIISARRRAELLTRLTTTGLSTVGSVTSVDTERVGKRTNTFLRFEFTDNFGRVIAGRSAPLSTNQEGLWTMGRNITVFYDPANSNCFTVNPNVMMNPGLTAR